MPRPALRSRSLRRVKVRLPGKYKVKYTKRKPSFAKCARCKKPLHGTARNLPVKIKGLAKSKKTVARPYGGNLCSKCMRLVIKEEKLGRWGYA